MSKGYNETSFKEDLKKLFLMIGVENKRTVFFLTQSQISEESMYLGVIKMNIVLLYGNKNKYFIKRFFGNYQQHINGWNGTSFVYRR